MNHNIARYRVIVLSIIFLIVGSSKCPVLLDQLRLNVELCKCLHFTRGQPIPYSLSPALHSERARYHLGINALFAGSLKKSLTYLSEHVRSDRTDKAAGFYLGLTYRRIGDEKSALAIWREVGAGPYFVHRGQKIESIDDMQTAIAVGASEPVTFYSLGDILYGKGRYKDASYAYKQGVTMDSSDGYITWLARGRLQEISENWSEAIAMYQRAIKIESSGAEAYIRAGEIYRNRMGNPNEALKWYVCCAQRIRWMWCYLLAAETERGLNHYDAALDWARQAQRLFPKVSFPLVSIGITWESLNNLGRARLAYLEALRLEPHNIWPSFYLGNIAMRTGNLNEAISYFHQVVNLRPNDPELQLLLGNAYQKAGRFDEAKMTYQRVLQLSPNNKHALAALIDLRK